MAKKKVVEVKPGYRTTQFWQNAAVVIGGLILGSGVIPETGMWPKVVGIIVAFLAARGYSIDRTTAYRS